MLTGERYTSTWKVKVACYDRQSEWCMRTHYICHPTVPFPALSHIPSPLLLLFQPSKLLKRYIHLRQLSLHLHIRPLRHLALVRPPRTGPGLAHTVGRAVVARAVQCAQEIQVQRPPGCLRERFRTSHLEREARAWPLVVPGHDRLATFTTAR